MDSGNDDLIKQDDNATSLSDILEKYKNVCLFYVKFDLGIFAAIATIISLLKIESSDIYKNVLVYKKPLTLLVVLTTFGLLFDFGLFKLWIHSKLRLSINRHLIRLISILSSLQVLTHIILIVLIGNFIFGYLEGRQSVIEKLDALFILQENIESYKNEFNKYPTTLEEMISASRQHFIEKYLEKLNPHSVSYKKDKNLGYILDYKFISRGREYKDDIYLKLDHQLYLKNKEEKTKSIEYFLQE